jgi:hypothetical protein
MSRRCRQVPRSWVRCERLSATAIGVPVADNRTHLPRATAQVRSLPGSGFLGRIDREHGGPSGIVSHAGLTSEFSACNGSRWRHRGGVIWCRARLGRRDPDGSCGVASRADRGVRLMLFSDAARATSAARRLPCSNLARLSFDRPFDRRRMIVTPAVVQISCSRSRRPPLMSAEAARRQASRARADRAADDADRDRAVELLRHAHSAHRRASTDDPEALRRWLLARWVALCRRRGVHSSDGPSQQLSVRVPCQCR